MNPEDQERYNRNVQKCREQPKDAHVRVVYDNGKVGWPRLNRVLKISQGVPGGGMDYGRLTKEVCIRAITSFDVKTASEVRDLQPDSCPVCQSPDIVRYSGTRTWRWRCRRCEAGFDDGDEGLDVDGLWYLWHRSDSNEHARMIVIGPYWDRGRGYRPAGCGTTVVGYEDVSPEYSAMPAEEQRAHLVHLLRKRNSGGE